MLNFYSLLSMYSLWLKAGTQQKQCFFPGPKGTVFLAEIGLVFQKLLSPFSVLVDS